SQERAIKELISSLENQPSSNGKIVLIAGDINSAQGTDSFEALVKSLCEIDNVYLLPAVSQSNIMGAYEMGLVPGLLPGRVSENNAEDFLGWTHSSDATS